MKLIISIIVQILINAVAIYIAACFVNGINVSGGIASLIIIGAVLGIINLVIKPVIKILSLPLIILTFGLFTVIINTICLLLVSFLMTSFSIENLSSAVLGVLIISLVNYIFSFFVKD